jgi:hypothetical protein
MPLFLLYIYYPIVLVLFLSFLATDLAVLWSFDIHTVMLPLDCHSYCYIAIGFTGMFTVLKWSRLVSLIFHCIIHTPEIIFRLDMIKEPMASVIVDPGSHSLCNFCIMKMAVTNYG